MNVEALRIFYEVGRHRSFSRAAAELRVTQSAVSQAVAQIEKELEKQLIDRSHRPPQLTPAGERFFVGCKDALERLDRAITQMRELDSEVVGAVHVASIYSVGLYHTDAIRKFMETYPKANVRLQYLRPNLVVEAVRQGEANLGLISYPRESRELAVVPWKEEEMVVVCPPGHRLAAKQIVGLEDLSGENFIAFDEDLTIRRQVDSVLGRKAEVRVVMEFDNVETMKQAVQIGAGIAILPEACVTHAVAGGTLCAIRLSDGGLFRPVGIIHRRGKPLSRAAATFMELLTGVAIAGETNGNGTK